MRGTKRPAIFEGTLLCTRKSNDDRTAVVLYVSDMKPDSPSLSEPRLVSVFDNELRFVGIGERSNRLGAAGMELRDPVPLVRPTLIAPSIRRTPNK